MIRINCEITINLNEQGYQKKDVEQPDDDLSRLGSGKQQLIACRERLESLQEIELSHSQYSEGVQKFLNHLQQNQTLATAGTLAEAIEAEPEYERLLGAKGLQPRVPLAPLAPGMMGRPQVAGG